MAKETKNAQVNLRIRPSLKAAAEKRPPPTTNGRSLPSSRNYWPTISEPNGDKWPRCPTKKLRLREVSDGSGEP